MKNDFSEELAVPIKRDGALCDCSSSANSTRQIWQWWNRHRLRYNYGLFIVGTISGLLVIFLGSAAVETGEDFVEPLMIVFGPLFYAICANIAYTAGPIYDTLFYCGEPRRNLFKAGYRFSLFLTAVPGLWAIFVYLTFLITGVRL